MRQVSTRRRAILLSCCLALGALGACSGAEAGNEIVNEATAAATEGQPLFDGASFVGWRSIESEAIPDGHWVIEDGMIRKLSSTNVATAADGQPLEGGDIMTVETYEHFIMTFEWKVAPGANSGIKYNVSQAMSEANTPSSAALGFEYQVLDDDLHPDALNGETRQAAGLYDMIGPMADKPLRPVGEFNEGRIVFVDGHGEHWLNGVKVLEYDIGSDRFDELLAASKYAPVHGFADLRAGHIVLQDHGDDVWYRNLQIEVIAR
jgi:hypothetical protein